MLVVALDVGEVEVGYLVVMGFVILLFYAESRVNDGKYTLPLLLRTASPTVPGTTAPHERRI